MFLLSFILFSKTATVNHIKKWNFLPSPLPCLYSAALPKVTEVSYLETGYEPIFPIPKYFVPYSFWYD